MVVRIDPFFGQIFRDDSSVGLIAVRRPVRGYALRREAQVAHKLDVIVHGRETVLLPEILVSRESVRQKCANLVVGDIRQELSIAETPGIAEKSYFQLRSRICFNFCIDAVAVEGPRYSSPVVPAVREEGTAVDEESGNLIVRETELRFEVRLELA